MNIGIGQSLRLSRVPRRESARHCRAIPTRRLAGVRGVSEQPAQQARWFGMPNVIAVPCDVTDPEQVVAAASTVEGTLTASSTS